MIRHLFAIFLAIMPAAFGCGISWSVPLTHFEGVDEKGCVCYSREIGVVDFGGDLKLPLIMNFRSDRESSSPLLGKGWVLALLDSCFVQVGENAFQMTQPDGWMRPFYRKMASDTVLDGGVSWKAEINGDTITAWADCGWRFTYTRGRLTGIGAPKARQLELIYSGGRVTEIRENGVARVTVDVDSTDGMARALVFNGRRLEIGRAERPRVELVKGQAVIGGMDQSLSRISEPIGGIDRKFEFSVNDKLQPTLKISGGEQRLFTWSPSTRAVVSDNEWKYEIVSPGSGNAISIVRTDSSKKSQRWAENKSTGVLEESFDDGSRRTAYTFGSGPFLGRTRKVETMDPAGNKIAQTYVYDQEGRMVRSVRSDGGYEELKYAGKRLVERSVHSSDGVDSVIRYYARGTDGWGELPAKLPDALKPELTQMSPDRVVFHVTKESLDWVELFDKSGRLVVRMDGSGNIWKYIFADDARSNTMLLNGIPKLRQEFNSSGTITKAIKLNKQGELTNEVTEFTMDRISGRFEAETPHAKKREMKAP